MPTRRVFLHLTATLAATGASQFLLAACTVAPNTATSTSQPTAPPAAATAVPTSVASGPTIAPTTAAAGATAQPGGAPAPASGGGLKLPAYLPIASVKADLPGN